MGLERQLMDQEGDALLAPGARSPRLRETPIAASFRYSPLPLEVSASCQAAHKR